MPVAESLQDRPSALADTRPQRVSRYVRQHWRFLTILALSTLLTALYAYGTPYILYNDGDPLSYFEKAWWLLGKPGAADVPSRGPGYPLWLIVTGAATLDTWWGLVVSQIAMALSAPLLVYAMLSPISRNAAFVAGVLFALFGLPYVHMNWVMTEQLFLSVELIAFVMISRHWAGVAPFAYTRRDPWRRVDPWREPAWAWLASPYLIAAALAYDTMVKPAASVFFWIFVLVSLSFKVAPARRYIGPTILYIAIMGGWALHDYNLSPVRFPTLAEPASSAQREFADVYYGSGFGAAEQQPLTIRPEDGAASAKLYQSVAAAVAADRASGHWNIDDSTTVHQLYERFATNGDVVQNIFAHPNPVYFLFIVQAAAPAGGDQLLGKVAREHGNTGIAAVLRYFVKHPTVPLFGPPNPYVGFMFLMKYYRYGDFVATKQYGPRNLFIGRSHAPMVRETNGPNSKAFADSLRFFIDTFPQYIGLGPDYLKNFKDIDDFKSFVVSDPYFSDQYAGSMMGSIYGWLTNLYGEERAGRLMGGAALETTFDLTSAPGFLFGDFLATAFYSGGGFSVSVPALIQKPGAALARLRSMEDTLLTATVESAQHTLLPPSLAAYVGKVRERSTFSQEMAAVLEASYGAFKWFKLFFFFGMAIFALPLAISTKGGRLVAFLTIAYFVSAAAFSIVMIMPQGDPRHEDVFSFMPLFVTILGFAALPDFVRTMLRAEPAMPAPLARAASAGALPAQGDAYAGIEMLEILADAVNYNAYLLARVETFLKNGDKVIDFGAGAGTFALPLHRRGVDVTCIEPDATLRARLTQAGLPALAGLDDVVDESADYIYTLNVLEHIADDRGTVRALARKLKPAGRLFIYVPAFQLLYSSFDAKYGHLRRYRRQQLMGLIGAAGLRLRLAEYADSLGFAAALLYRVVGRDGGEVSPAAIKAFDRWIFPLSRLLDRLLWRVLGKNVCVVAEKDEAFAGKR